MARFPKYQASEDHRKQVRMMSGFGIPQEAIASLIMCDLKTLRKYYRYELDNGMTEANTRVAQALYMNATRHNNVAAQIWWTKCRMGWYPTPIPDSRNDDRDLVVDFRWADAPNATEANKVIEFTAEANAEGTEVVWQDNDAGVP